MSASDAAARAEHYLLAWHRRHADSSRSFVAVDSDGRSSYDRLASLATKGRVLDLACGSGALLELVQDRVPARDLHGIDLSASELALAQARVPVANLTMGRAQALPYAKGTMQLVLCHMALMLIDDPGSVLREISRVLSDGGRFGAVTYHATPPDGTVATVLRGIQPLFARLEAVQRVPALGDPAVCAPVPLSALVAEYFDDVVTVSFQVTQQIRRSSLWETLATSVYGFDAIPLRNAEAVLASLELPDPVPWTIPMLFVHARRRAD